MKMLRYQAFSDVEPEMEIDHEVPERQVLHVITLKSNLQSPWIVQDSCFQCPGIVCQETVGAAFGLVHQYAIFNPVSPYLLLIWAVPGFPHPDHILFVIFHGNWPVVHQEVVGDFQANQTPTQAFDLVNDAVLDLESRPYHTMIRRYILSGPTKTPSRARRTK